MDASKGDTIYLHFARSYINEDQTAQGVTFTYYALAELRDRMVFYRVGSLYLGDYNEAFIFESFK